MRALPCLLALAGSDSLPAHRSAAYQKAVREQKLALELAAATRERDFYLKQVDAGKALDAMAAKQQRRADAAAAAAGEGGEGVPQRPPAAASAPAGKQRTVRTFTQVRCRFGALMLRARRSLRQRRGAGGVA